MRPETPLIYQLGLLREYQLGDRGRVYVCGQRGHKKDNRWYQFPAGVLWVH